MIAMFLACLLSAQSIPTVVAVHVESDWPGSSLVVDGIRRMRPDVVLSSSPDAKQLLDGTTVLAPGGMHGERWGDVVVMTGGYFGACFANAVRCCDSRMIVIPMRCVFASNRRTLADMRADVYRDDAEFLEYVRAHLDVTRVAICGEVLVVCR